jgi:sugar O-acyltransferase (sialic acid O-acetyltransferase NeuD family)
MILPFHTDSRIAIIGAGGLGKEVLCTIGELIGWEVLRRQVSFVVEEEYYDTKEVFGINVLPLSYSNPGFDLMVLAIGDPATRIRITNALPASTRFATIIHPSVQLTPYTRIGEGSVIHGQVFLSCDVELGKFALINPGTTISHDSSIGDFFTCSPGVHISGTCSIGHRVFMGTGACIRNAIAIADDVTIGMGAVVTKDILTKGTYIGNPASLIEMKP